MTVTPGELKGNLELCSQAFYDYNLGAIVNEISLKLASLNLYWGTTTDDHMQATLALVGRAHDSAQDASSALDKAIDALMQKAATL